MHVTAVVAEDRLGVVVSSVDFGTADDDYELVPEHEPGPEPVVGKIVGPVRFVVLAFVLSFPFPPSRMLSVRRNCRS